MSIGYINTNEPKRVKRAFEDILDPYPLAEFDKGEFDMLLFTKAGAVAIERKKIPQDLLVSIDDGRLSRELVALREMGIFKLVILEGKFRYRNNVLMSGRRTTRWTRSGMRNLLRSVRYFEGVDVEFSENLEDTVNLIVTLKKYLDAEDHHSLRSRPNMRSEYLYPVKEERILWFYQGFPGISVVRARTLFNKYPRPLDLISADACDIIECNGFGSKLSQGVYDFLRGN